MGDGHKDEEDMARLLQEERERLVQEIEQDESDGPEIFYREKRE